MVRRSYRRGVHASLGANEDPPADAVDPAGDPWTGYDPLIHRLPLQFT